MSRRLYGKYRGSVVNNADPLQIGRIMASVPAFSKNPTSWALPCLPWGGVNTGVFAVPLIGAGVWIEFERGETDHPIWTGCYWGSSAEVPSLAKSVPPTVASIALQTQLKNGILISDVPGSSGGILIQTATGASISVSDVGIVISNGKGAVVNLTGPTVDINNGALTVT